MFKWLTAKTLRAEIQERIRDLEMDYLRNQQAAESYAAIAQGNLVSLARLKEKP